MLPYACPHRSGALRTNWNKSFTLCPLMEHFLIPWSLLRVRSDNIRYPLILALLVCKAATLPPVSEVFAVPHCLCLVVGQAVWLPMPLRHAHWVLWRLRCHTGLHLSLGDLLQAIPCFQLGRIAMRLGSLFA